MAKNPGLESPVIREKTHLGHIHLYNNQGKKVDYKLGRRKEMTPYMAQNKGFVGEVRSEWSWEPELDLDLQVNYQTQRNPFMCKDFMVQSQSTMARD